MVRRLIRLLTLLGICFGMSTMAIAQPMPHHCGGMTAQLAQSDGVESTMKHDCGCPSSDCKMIQCLAMASSGAAVSESDVVYAIDRYPVRERAALPQRAKALQGQAPAPELRPPVIL
jgi:hypothetical protein